jgi:hypothetical protein
MNTKRFLVVYDNDGDIFVTLADLTPDQEETLTNHFSIPQVIPLDSLMEFETTSFDDLMSLPEEL